MLMQPSYICKYETIWDYPTEACFAHLVSLGSLKVFQQVQGCAGPQRAGDNDDPSLRKVVIQGTKEQIARCDKFSFEKPNWMKVGEFCYTKAPLFWSNFVIVSPDFSFQV